MGYEQAIVRVFGWAPGRPTAGLGLLVGAEQIVTCAHVVNAALGREVRAQERPAASDLVAMEFPFLPGRPVRQGKVTAWQPPPSEGVGPDVAGLELEERIPDDLGARFRIDRSAVGAPLRVYGYPLIPPRPEGTWVDLVVKGQVTSGLLQMESRGDQTIKAQPGFSGSPVWDDRACAPVGLLTGTALAEEAYADAYLMPAGMVAEAWEEQFDYLLLPDNPYRGLAAFTAVQKDAFFGRDQDIAAVAALVRAEPVVAVVGASGVGKSSLVLAGVVPVLDEEQPRSIAVFRPGQDPWERLAAALLRAQSGAQVRVDAEQAREMVQAVRAEGLGPLARYLRSQDRPLLVVADQLEELFTAASPDRALLDLLIPLEGEDAGVRVVLTIRADFFGALIDVPGIGGRLSHRIHALSPLTPQVWPRRAARARPTRPGRRRFSAVDAG